MKEEYLYTRISSVIYHKKFRYNLNKTLKVKDGYLDDKLRILDFASGTGTFILALVDYINIKLIESGKKTLFDSEIREHILKTYTVSSY